MAKRKKGDKNGSASSKKPSTVSRKITSKMKNKSVLRLKPSSKGI
jgi:hypothetical protein